MFHVIFSKSSHIDISQHKADLVKVKNSCLSWIFPLAACWPRGQVGLVRLVSWGILMAEISICPRSDNIRVIVPIICFHFHHNIALHVYPGPSHPVFIIISVTTGAKTDSNIHSGWQLDIMAWVCSQRTTHIHTYIHTYVIFIHRNCHQIVGFLRFTLKIWEIIHDFNN